MGLLQKIAWRTRRWNIKFNLLDIFLHDGDGCWGFTFFEIVKDFRPYSLLSIEFRLPNGGNVKEFTIDNWDFLFLATTPMYRLVIGFRRSYFMGNKTIYITKNWTCYN